MTDCFFSQPEDLEGRKQLRDLKYQDVFPRANPYYSAVDDLFPENVTNIVHQLRSQEYLRQTAQHVNKHLERMNLTKPVMTDDQRRAQKIKDRMMLKRKMQK